VHGIVPTTPEEFHGEGELGIDEFHCNPMVLLGVI
jgi:hypothetical protein